MQKKCHDSWSAGPPHLASYQPRVKCEELSVASFAFCEAQTVASRERVEQTTLRECVLGHRRTAPAVADGCKLLEIAAQDELCAHVGEPIERRDKLDIKLTYFIDPEGIHITGAMDNVSSNPCICCAAARA